MRKKYSVSEVVTGHILFNSVKMACKDFSALTLLDFLASRATHFDEANGYFVVNGVNGMPQHYEFISNEGFVFYSPSDLKKSKIREIKDDEKDSIGEFSSMLHIIKGLALRNHDLKEKISKMEFSHSVEKSFECSDLLPFNNQPETKLSDRYPAYYKDVSNIDEIDVYKTHELFNIQDPSGCIQHSSKKLLLSGVRTGGKSKYKDIKEARDTLNRWLEINAHLIESES